ncbi:MAG TPA: TlpA disulfide reductase family protein [Tepidisphaeraceae bacterium]|nr:TlpA disulfide reductase family protein [Tepidisphaeraceae bacterium]
MKRLEGKPFAIVGVNSDSDREKIKQRIGEEHITWRSFWNNGTAGPIAMKWNVFSWPTTYVLDAKGVIRFKEVRGQSLDDAVDSLLKEMGVTVAAHPPATQE